MRSRIPSSILSGNELRKYVKRFNSHGYTWGGQAIPDERAADWMARNVPRFQCPDKDMEEIYHYRWWTFRKHLKKTPEGHVVTEFLPKVPWSGKYNAISCPLGHHFYEGRWIGDPCYLDDYARFWTSGSGDPRRYSSWLANAVYARSCVTGDREQAIVLLPDLISNYEAWEASHLDDNGLFWQEDDRDGMECSISGRLAPGGKGHRPTINSYMYGDARAIAEIATWARKDEVASIYQEKAAALRTRVMVKLWDADARFFKVLPRTENAVLSDVRELHGYTPWYFDLPPARKSYEVAWKQLMDPRGFHAPFGPTTAERRHPDFSLSYEGHECQWNGPSWPFSTAVTLTAMANVLNNYPQDAVSRADFFDVLKAYTSSHRLKRGDGSVVPWIDENLHPYTGDWISRSRLKVWDNGTWSEKKGGLERGENYNHSTYCDLIISGLVGLRPRADNKIEVNPLVPVDIWDYFCLDQVRYHGHVIAIVWDRTGQTYGIGKGLSVLVDGEFAGNAPTLTRVVTLLPPRNLMESSGRVTS